MKGETVVQTFTSKVKMSFATLGNVQELVGVWMFDHWSLYFYINESEAINPEEDILYVCMPAVLCIGPHSLLRLLGVQ